MTKSWPVESLGSLASIAAGGTPSRSKLANFDGDIPWVKISDMMQGIIYETDEQISEAGLNSSSAKMFPAGTLLLSIFATVGRTAVLGIPAATNQAIAGITPLDNSKLDRDYLRRYLDSAIAQLVGRARGVAQVNINLSILRELQIPLPPLPEQRRIADILDRADDLRAQRRLALAEIDAFRDALVRDLRRKSAGSWDVVSMEDAYWFQEGPGVRKWQFTDEGVKLLNVGNILKAGQLDLARTTKHISNDEASGKYKHFLVDEGDLVIASSGIGIDTDGLLRTRGAFVSAGDLPLCMNTSTIRFKAREGISTLPYLQAWLSSYSFRSQISRLVTGSAQKNFGPSHLKQLTIELPPIDVQRTIENLTLAASALRSEHESALAKLDELFASLQHRAFQGEL